MAGKSHLLLRPLISSHHGRVVIYWALILLAVIVFREPHTNSIVLIRGISPDSTAVAAFLPPDTAVLVKKRAAKKTNGLAREVSLAKSSFVYLNSAGKSELCQIKGIGPVLAGRIIQYRKDNGKFSSIDELEGVKGIGPKTVAKLKNQAIRVGR